MVFSVMNLKDNKLYSFGQVLLCEGSKCTVGYKNIKIVVLSQLKLEISDWVLLYGRFKGGIYNIRFIEKIMGVNIDLLERVALFVKKTVEERR